MKLGIDASNLRSGGGVTHLVELLRTSQPVSHGFEKVIVWSNQRTLSLIEERSWLQKIHEPMIERPLPIRLYWQRVILDRLARRTECDVVFAPGGSYSATYRPFVVMSQNLLPFEWSEAQRYKVSWTLIRLALLRHAQTRTFRAADGVIFMTRYAREVVMRTVRQLRGQTALIPHGVNKKFFLSPRRQKEIANYSNKEPFRVLYVSSVDVYKHQWYVVEAVAKLRAEGMPIELDLIGPAYLPALKRLQQMLRRFDPTESFIRYRGSAPYSELFTCYHQTDLLVFASSCENMPNILIEAMASGLSIACSNRGPMPEILGNFGAYFDPEQPEEIAKALRKLVLDVDLRERCALGAYEKARTYSWEQCANETFCFIKQVAENYWSQKI